MDDFNRERTPDAKRDEAFSKRKQADLQLLRETRQKAENGFRLEHPRNLHAALELGKRYRQARKAHGFSESDLVDIALDRLETRLQAPAEFPIRKLVLKRAIDALTADVIRDHRGSDLPQKQLSHYLAAVQAIACLSGEDETEAQISFLRVTRCWDENAEDSSSEATWSAVGKLTANLRRLAALISKKFDLKECFLHQDRLGAKWDAFFDEVHLSSMSGVVRTNVSVEGDCGQHLLELCQYPSIPLIYIPMAWADGTVRVEEGPGRNEPGMEHCPSGFSDVKVRLTQCQEIRLTLSPSPQGKMEVYLQSRGLVLLGFAEGEIYPVWGTCHYTTHVSERQEIFRDGWREVQLQGFPQELEIPWEEGSTRDLLHTRINPASGDPDSMNWEWDPVLRPGECYFFGPEYWSFTSMTQDHLYHWLIQDHRFDGMSAICPWTQHGSKILARVYPPLIDEGKIASSFGKGDMVYGIDAPFGSAAFALEQCLHNGLLVDALELVARRMKEQTDALLEEQEGVATEAESRLHGQWAERFGS
ncbi:hypothetical protein [Alloyangia pacifica]|uniref:hypothetical protein n=1 Tax=Alloyangia pacifica TaxID=311180 RepID=UPI001CFEAC54|nr:hypothetical protein [Alloyangia pacifica]